MHGAAIVGITIGIGSIHAPLAAKAAEAAQRFYHLDKVLMLGERELYQFCLPLKKYKDRHRQICFLKFVVPMLGYDRWVFVDADYRVLREPSQEELNLLHNDPRFIATLDYWDKCPYQYPYYNGGFFVANRAHADLFAWCRKNYFTVPETWAEQCVLNAGIHDLKIDVLTLDRRYNRALPDTHDPIAHHGLTWEHWHGVVPDDVQMEVKK